MKPHIRLWRTARGYWVAEITGLSWTPHLLGGACLTIREALKSVEKYFRAIEHIRNTF